MKNARMLTSTIVVLAMLFGPYGTVLAEDLEVRITPERLKLDGGKQASPWVSCHVTLPEGYNPEEVTENNTLLEDLLTPVLVEACDVDSQLVVIHFDKDEVRDYLKGTRQTDLVILTITIEIGDETLEGSDTIRVK